MKSVATLFEQASKTRLHAYAPYSKFSVGACLETATGELFSACNVENASYGLCVCAESSAIAAMVAAGSNKEIKQIMVVVSGPGVSAPCGGCRQRLNEFAKPEAIIHLCDLEGAHETYSLGELLPHAFGPEDVFPSLNKEPVKQ